MIALDASVVIALLSDADAHHTRATIVMESHSAGGFVVHDITMAEILVGAARNGRATERLTELRSLGIRTAVAQADQSLLLAELRASTGLHLPDCCVLATGLSEGVPLATFDDRLARAAADVGLEVLT